MKELRQFVDKMQATSSSLDKVEILKQQPEFIKKILEYTYNPYKQFYVTSKTCIKNKNIIKKDYFGEDIDLFETLDQLTTRKVTGHDAIKLVNGFNFHVGEGIYDIIDKDLKIRTGAKVINKAFPGLIPEFNVALAKEYEPGKCNWDDGWFASRKLDGVRCLARVDHEGNCTLFSRTGKEFTTLNKVKEAIEATGIINVTFDGEVCLVDDKGDEDFQGIMKQLRRKDHQIKNPAYMLFDMLSNAEFDSCKGDTLLENRLSTLSSWCPEMNYECDDNGQPMHLNILRNTDQIMINGDDHLEAWNTVAEANNWEGVMLRKNCGYEGKRTKNLVKVKKFHDAEYTVVDCDVAPMSVVRDGKEAQETMLAQVYIEHKGHLVKVGSGFSQEQRIKYLTEDIVGKTITVQYFEETHNDKGGISLRFPTVKHIYEGKRDC
jgi:DNA ligase 1